MEIFRRITRWLFAIGSVGFSIHLIRKGIEAASITGSFFPILAALVLLVIAVVVIAPELVAVATRPLFALVDSIFFPGGKLSRPVLSYTLPDFYLKEKRYEEALEEFRKILHFYPKEAKAYLGAIDLLIVEFDDPSEAKELYTRACRKLQDRPEELQEIANRWQWLSNRYVFRN